MVRSWVKLLPYWFVMWITKKFGADWATFNNRKVRYWRIDKGEFVIWDEENYKILGAKEKEYEEEKKSRRQKKFEKLKEEFEPDEEDFEE